MDLFAEIKALVVDAIGRLADAGRLPQGLDLSPVTVEPPRDPAHGDMATNAAMVLARPARMAPRGDPRWLKRWARRGGRTWRATGIRRR